MTLSQVNLMYQFVMKSFRLVWVLPAVNPIFYSFFARDFKNRISQIGKHLASFKSKIANPLMLTPLLPNKPVLTQEGTKFI